MGHLPRKNNSRQIVFPPHFIATFEQLREAGRMSILRTSALLLFFPLVAMAQSNSDINPPNKIKFADQFPGADACIQTQNAIPALPVHGRAVDANGLLAFLSPS